MSRLKRFVALFAFYFLFFIAKADSLQSLISENWYIVYTEPAPQKMTPIAYYHETLRKKDDKLNLEQSLFTKDRHFVIKEELGLVLEDNHFLSPTSLFFQKTNMSIQLLITVLR